MSESAEQAENLFCEAAAIADPAARAAFLDAACKGDAVLRAEIEALLAHDANGERSFGFSGLDAGRTAGAAAESTGAVIGPYTLIEQIGEGGFGAVYLAEQSVPVRRKVALKILKPGMDTRQVVARFEAERQALAILDHPNIARVFDGGATPSGRPYFVMELVKGVPITEFCDDHRLSPDERLKLFIDVCKAVQHAHQKGIIHRDLKPSNILVSRHDATPVVKVIDFGIAKALGQELTEKTLHTGFAHMIGTPLYMSPEQAGMSALDVDTRSDVYSLGVLLYELLTGTTPFDRERFERAAYDEIRRIIRDEDPPKPSTRLSESADSLPSVAAQRHVEPARLSRLLRGELDWIVMKALEKDRDRRYETANGFAADVQRHLCGEAVQAVPPSAAYRMRKFVRRHRAPLSVGALVVATLLVGVVGTSWGMFRATRAAEDARHKTAEANAVLAFLDRHVFAAARPKGQDGGLGKDVSLRDALKAGLTALDSSFANQPLVETRLRMTHGVTLLHLGEARAAEAQFVRAREIYLARLGPDHPDTLNCQSNLANCCHALDRHDEALALREETYAVRRRVQSPDHPDAIGNMNDLANSYYVLGRHEQAVALHERALDACRRYLPPDNPLRMTSMSNLAAAYAALGRHADSLELHKEALEARTQALSADHPSTLRSKFSIAICLSSLGRRKESIELFEETLAARKLALPEDHYEVLQSKQYLADRYFEDERYADALRLSQEALPELKRHFSADHVEAILGLRDVVKSLYMLGRTGEAVPLVDELVALAPGKPLDPDVVPSMLETRMEHFQSLDDPAGCRATAAMWEKFDRRDARSLLLAACFRATAAEVQSKAGGADAARRSKEDADKAMTWLTRADARGELGVDELRTNPALAVLRDRADFAKLLEAKPKRTGK